MKRELKFRAWDKATKTMVNNFMLGPTSPDWSPFVIRIDDGADALLNDYWRNKGDLLGGDYTSHDWSDYYAIGNYEVMQFTGLRDDLGNDLYEGDVIEFDCEEMGTEKGLVRFADGGFWTSQPKGMDEQLLSDELHQLKNKKIGDIFSNPGLLTP